jgi:hypothetical protein
MIGPGPIAGDEDAAEGECEGASGRDTLAVRVFIASRRVAVFLRVEVLFAFLAVAFFMRTSRLHE